MAEIHLERKNRSPWLWLLMGLAALLIGVWLVARWRGDAPARMGDVVPGAGVSPGAPVSGTADGAVAGTQGALADYLSYVEENRARQAAGPSHEYTAEGIRRLAAAVAQLSERNAPGGNLMRAEIDAVRGQADSLQRNPTSTEHARYAREGFRSAAALMSALQQRHYPNLGDQVTQVREAAEALRPGTVLLEQAAQVQRFFDQSATALRAMATATT